MTERLNANWISPAQAGHILGLTPMRVRQLCDAGTLSHEMTAIGRLIDPASVEDLRRRRLLGRLEQPTAA